MVCSTITITEGDESATRTMWLPVMNNKNQAIVRPDARQISDNMQRCMVKCIAMLGLGLYVYAGEDLPKSDKEEAESVDRSNVDTPQLLAAQKTIKDAYAAHGKGIFEFTSPESVKSQNENDVIAAAQAIIDAGLLSPERRQ